MAKLTIVVTNDNKKYIVTFKEKKEIVEFEYNSLEDAVNKAKEVLREE